MQRFFVFLLCASTCCAANITEIGDLIGAGNRSAARELASRWLAESPGGIDRAHALNSVALTWVTSIPADTDRVRQLTAESLSISRLAGDAKTEAESLLIWGTQLAGAGDFKTAREVLTQALEREPEPQSREKAAELTELGSLLNTATSFAEAKSRVEQAVAIGESLPGRGLAESLSVLANIGFTTGDYSGAKRYADRAIALFDAEPVPGVMAGHARMFRAHILVRLGDFAGASAELERAVVMDTRVFGPDSVQVADDRNASGATAGDSGDLAAAKKWFRVVLSIYQKVLGPENTRTGGAWNNLGQALMLLREFTEAKQCFERALAIQTKVLGATSTSTVNLYQGLARVAAATGDYPAAEKYFEQNLAVWKVALGPTHASTLNTQTMLADVIALEGDRARSMKMALEVARLRRNYVTDTVRTVSEREALQIAGRRGTSLNTVLALAGDSTASTTLAWDELVRSRALVVDEMAARYRAVRASANPGAAALLDTAKKARAELAQAALTFKDPHLPEKRLALQRAEEALAAESSGSQDRLRREKAGFADIIAALPANAALISYVKFTRPDLSNPGNDAVPSYSVFVIRGGAGAVPRVLSLGVASLIDQQVAALSREISRERNAVGHSGRRNEETYRAAGMALRRTVWDPLAKLIAGAGSVYIVPDGALQVVNWGGLPVGPTAGHYLVESGPLMHMLSAERSLLASPSFPSAGTAKPGKALLALGNPSVAHGDSVICAGQFDALPGSQRETVEVASIWKSLGGTAEILTGDHASELALQSSSAGKTAIHIATHGFYIDDHCGGAGAASDNPLLRSGLVLAGGVFTAAQVASLNLDGVDWVVLSGCDTGLGDIRASEGVLGLRRAFQEAGARTVVASLWPVDDDATRGWMTSLYKHRFVNKESAAQAMRAAQRQSLRTRRAAGLSTHPYYWAGFIAVEQE